MMGVDGGFPSSTQGMSLEEMDERAARFSGVPQPGHFYRLEVHLKEGKDLAVRDWSGKINNNNKVFHKFN